MVVQSSARVNPLQKCRNYIMSHLTGIGLVALIVLSIAIRVIYIDVPGPQGDEVYMPYVAMQMKMNDPIGHPKIELFGHQLPLTIGSYAGALPVYIYRGILLFFYHPLLFRFVNILGAVLATYLVFKLGRDFWNSDRIGLVAAAVFTEMPASVFYSRIGEFASFLRVPLFAALALFTFRTFRTGKPAYFYLTCFVLGLAVNIRLDGIWWAPVFAFAAVLTLIRTRPAIVPLSLAKNAIVGSMAFLVGSIPYSIYVLRDWRGMLNYIAANASVSSAGADNRMVLQNLIRRLTQVFTLTDGTSLLEFGMHPLTAVLPNSLVLAAGLALTAYLVVRGFSSEKNELGLDITCGAIVLIPAISVITLSTYKPWHILMVLPFVALVIAHFIDQVIRKKRYLGFGLLAILLLSNLYAVAQDYKGLLQWRGGGGFSMAVYDLTNSLQEQKIQSVTTGDWGLARLIYYLSDGSVKTSECFVYAPHPPMPDWFYNRIDETLKQDSTWVFYAGNNGDVKAQQEFLKYLAHESIAPAVQTISDSYGPVYNIYRIGRTSPGQ